jgi:glycosyltransferase involved in cell wall biosynthesis
MNKEVELSVVMPCLNEEDTLKTCIQKIKEEFHKLNIFGEIIVVDNGSSDSSSDIARSEGAIILFEPLKGYGSAYLRGLKEAKGRYIIIADSDDTYDFHDIPAFLQKLRGGCDFVIGSRFKGKIKRGAMSWTHRYLGNPILSGMCRLFFRTSLSDIHCGMRAFTSEAFHKMQLESLGMEFATEMVVSALQEKLNICEVPVDYHPRKGKSKLEPLSDAWRHIRFMLLYCPVWLYFIPGAIGFISGLSLTILLLNGPVFFLGRYWDLHVNIFASAICILSYQILNLGIYAHTYAINQGFLKFDRFTNFLQRYFKLERGLLAGAAIFLSGLLINIFIFIEWFSKDFGSLYRIRESILATTLLVIGLQTIFSSFFVSLLFLRRK